MVIIKRLNFNEIQINVGENYKYFEVFNSDAWMQAAAFKLRNQFFQPRIQALARQIRFNWSTGTVIYGAMVSLLVLCCPVHLTWNAFKFRWCWLLLLLLLLAIYLIYNCNYCSSTRFCRSENCKSLHRNDAFQICLNFNF